MTDYEITFDDEFFKAYSTFVNDNNVKLLDKKMDIFDIVTQFLENNQSEDPFFIVNLGDIIRQYKKWQHYLPNIEPFYAVKCNPDPIILKLLANLGCSFDCASQNEIAKIINLKVHPDKIIYANPSKQIAQVKFARIHDVDFLVFDSEHELYKIKLYHAEAKLVIRIKTDDKNSLCKFSCKFGAEMDEIDALLKMAKLLDLQVIGVSFHVGSGCFDHETYRTAICDSKRVFDIAKKLDIEMYLLDIGGGFPGVDSEKISFPIIAQTINNSIEEYFGGYTKNLKVIAEPGRYFVASSHTLIFSIINKKIRVDKETGKKVNIYYCNEGTYFSFNNVIMDHFEINENNLVPLNEKNEKRFKSILFGPTCDSMDLITQNIQLPNLSVGSYLMALHLGAYSNALSITGSEMFNGFNRTKSHYILN